MSVGTMSVADGCSIGTLRFVCSFTDCNKYFANAKYLRRHQKPSFPCPTDDCLKLFWTQNDLERHMKTPHTQRSNKVFECMYCTKFFKHKFDLKVHEAVHTGEKPLLCERCGAKFAIKNRLRQHMKTHKTYSCSLDGCAFTCDKWSLMRKHVSDYHKKKCPSCCKMFVSDESLRKHIATHSLVLKCSHCELSYSNKSNLRTHIRAVHEKITYKCPFEGCHKELHHRKSLRQHVKSHKQTDHTVRKRSEANMTIRSTLMVELITGEAVEEDDKRQLLEQDKAFRIEFKNFQSNVRIC